MDILKTVATNPLEQGLVPGIFFVVGQCIAVPQILLDILIHPLAYISAPNPVDFAKTKFFFFAYRVMAPFLDRGNMAMKRPLLAKCYGITVEVGPGMGNNIKYYNREKVKQLVLVEPTVDMHTSLRLKANEAGYFEKDASLVLLACGAAASDEDSLARAGLTPDSVDCIVSIHVLCSVPQPAAAIELYRRLLMPGGLFIFFEHVRSDRNIAATFQNLYNTVWPIFMGGCCLNRPTGVWIAKGPEAVDEKKLLSGLEIVNGKNPDPEVQSRWKEIKMDRPEFHQINTCLPQVKGWAIK